MDQKEGGAFSTETACLEHPGKAWVVAEPVSLCSGGGLDKGDSRMLARWGWPMAASGAPRTRPGSPSWKGWSLLEEPHAPKLPVATLPLVLARWPPEEEVTTLALGKGRGRSGGALCPVSLPHPSPPGANEGWALRGAPQSPLLPVAPSLWRVGAQIEQWQEPRLWDGDPGPADT